MKIASFNVNSIQKRLGAVLAWLDRHQPDFLVLQEIKSTDEKFPFAEIAAAGYQAQVVGQKAYNGVAILSRQSVEIRQRALLDDDPQARYLEIATDDLILGGLYLPNGNPTTDDTGAPSAKFQYKLDWIDSLIDRARTLLAEEKMVVLAGDFNIIPEPEDVYDPTAWSGDALFRPEVHAGFRRLQHLGYWDAWRTVHPDRRGYSFWDYQAGRWPKGEGLRIDHLMLSPLAAERLTAAEIDPEPRGQPEPSDHTPIWCTLDR